MYGTRFFPGFELSKNKWGVDICLVIVVASTHRRFSIINNGGGLKLTPPRVSQGIMFGGGGVGQTTGGVQPPQPPGNSNTAFSYIPRGINPVLLRNFSNFN
jgi:hypothetical protein